MYRLLEITILFAILGRVESVARLVRLPLEQSTTQNAGQLGQPVISYYTKIGIGSPQVVFNVSFDTDFSELFVPHFLWNPFSRNLHHKTGFQCKLSSTCTKDDQGRSIEYQGCRLEGKRYWDKFNINFPAQLEPATHKYRQSNSNTLATWKQNFLAISDASDARFSPLPVDGFLGLSPMPQSASSLTNIMVNLRDAHLIDNLQFSFYFNPVLDSAHGGELILGGVDPNRYQGQIYWHPLPSQPATQWQLKVQQVTLGAQVVGCSAPSPSCLARFSTSQSDIYGPEEVVRRIYSSLNTVGQSSSKLRLIDCRRIHELPVLSFNIDGIPYALLPTNYIRKTTDGLIFKRETCYVAILPQASSSSANGEWILGTNFLGAYYSIFDMTYAQIGFAALR